MKYFSFSIPFRARLHNWFSEKEKQIIKNEKFSYGAFLIAGENAFLHWKASKAIPIFSKKVSSKLRNHFVSFPQKIRYTDVPLGFCQGVLKQWGKDIRLRYWWFNKLLEFCGRVVWDLQSLMFMEKIWQDFQSLPSTKRKTTLSEMILYSGEWIIIFLPKRRSIYLTTLCTVFTSIFRVYPLQWEFIALNSYTQTSGPLRLSFRPSRSCQSQHQPPHSPCRSCWAHANLS